MSNKANRNWLGLIAKIFELFLNIGRQLSDWEQKIVSCSQREDLCLMMRLGPVEGSKMYTIIRSIKDFDSEDS